jgi:hypothetical protein
VKAEETGVTDSAVMSQSIAFGGVFSRFVLQTKAAIYSNIHPRKGINSFSPLLY